MKWRRLLAAFAFALLLPSAAAPQTRFSYSSGQPLEPAYEGWMQNKDGSYTLYFGYMNTNWLQEFDIPIGPDNRFEPGDPDRGQPTHFYPRRNPFLFTITVAKDFGKQELMTLCREAGLRLEREWPCIPYDVYEATGRHSTTETYLFAL